MASQAFSASANVLKGDPPTLMAGLLKLMGRQEATKPGFPWSPGPLLLSLLITNEKPRSLALHISRSPVAGPMRPKCMGAFHDPASQNGPSPLKNWGRHSNAPRQGATMTGASINEPSCFPFLKGGRGGPPVDFQTGGPVVMIAAARRGGLFSCIGCLERPKLALVAKGLSSGES
jgi:hypothetical protein